MSFASGISNSKVKSAGFPLNWHFHLILFFILIYFTILELPLFLPEPSSKLYRFRLSSNNTYDMSKKYIQISFR